MAVKYYQVRTNDNALTKVPIEDYVPADIADQLNDASVNMVAIGTMVASRHSITSIIPVKEADPDIE